MKNKVLFLITSSFPFGHEESFLENEYPYLAKRFEQIFIITNRDCNESSKRPVTSSTKVIFLRYLPNLLNKLCSLRYLLNKHVREEINLLSRYELGITKKSILNTILTSYHTGNRLSDLIVSIIDEHNLSNNQLYAYSYWCNDMAVGLTVLKQKKPEIITICRAHGFDVYFERNTINYLPFRKFIYSTLDRVFFISKNGLKYASQKTGHFKSLNLSYLGTPVPSSKVKQKEKAPFLIISCSRCVEVKRLDLIILSLSLIKKENNIKWIHVGAGPLLPSLKKLAAERLSNNVQYNFIGNLPNNSLLDYYLRISPNLFINTSKSEGLPVTMMEAMSVGIPVLGLDVGGVSEILNDNYNGFLLSSDVSANEIATSIEAYINTPFHKKLAMAENAKKTWEAKFNAPQNFDFFINSFIQTSS